MVRVVSRAIDASPAEVFNTLNFAAFLAISVLWAIASLVISFTKPTSSAAIAVMVNNTKTIFFNELFIHFDYLVPKRLGLQYLLISGVAAFIMNIANDIPSG